MTFPSLEAIGQALRSRQVSVPEVVAGTLAAIERENPRLQAFVTVLGSQALQEAEERQAELDRHADRGPLHGIPVAIKDIIDVAGVRTSAGSAAFDADPPAPRDARVVALLRDAGAIPVGKTATHELAIGGPRRQPPYPTGRNPWDLDRITGGSSSGNGAAVAAGLVAAAVGSDTGGSIRNPASNCGITGLKPTWGSIVLDGVIPLIPSMDTLGPMARSARDARLLLEPMLEAPTPPRWDVSRPLVIGIERRYFRPDALHPGIGAIVDAVATTLEGPGFSLRDHLQLDTPEDPELVTPEGMRDCWRTFLAETWAHHRRRYAVQAGRFAGATQALEDGRDRPAWRYVTALEQRQRLARAFARLFEECDLLLVPASPALAMTFDEAERSFPPPPTAFAMSANLAGLCAIVAPGGFLDGLPVGFQLMAPPGNEALLLHAVEQFQARTDWHLRTPPGIG